MKRYLTESDLQPLSDEDYRLILTEQFETQRRLREQAQSLIRMIISAVGLVIALLGYRLYPDFQLPDRTVATAGGSLQFDGLVESMAESTIFVAAIFAIITFGLLLFSVTKSIAILSDDGPVPLSRHKSIEKKSTTHFDSNSNEKLAEWILTNDSRLVEAERQVEQSYTHIWASFFTAFVAILLAGSAFFGLVPMMGALNLIVLVAGPLVFIHYMKDTLSAFFSNSINKGVRTAIDKSGHIFYDSMRHRGLDFTMKVILILIYGSYYEYSINVVRVWYFL